MGCLRGPLSPLRRLDLEALTYIQAGGNAKLGPGIATMSRPVGETCPTDCPLLGTVCYAERLENFRPTVRAAWRRSIAPEWGDLAREFRSLPPRIKAFRIHVGGDFLWAGRIDTPYLRDLASAIEGTHLPGWCYTHAWRQLGPWRARFESLGVRMYASIHTEREATEAFRSGWRLAYEPGRRLKPPEMPRELTVAGERALTCPEQRKGIPCDRCGLCWRAGRHVVFWRH